MTRCPTHSVQVASAPQVDDGQADDLIGRGNVAAGEQQHQQQQQASHGGGGGPQINLASQLSSLIDFEQIDASKPSNMVGDLLQHMLHSTHRYPTPGDTRRDMRNRRRRCLLGATSYRRLFSMLFLALTLANIGSMLWHTIAHFRYIHAKEEMEKYARNAAPYYPYTNKDAYAVVRFVNFISLVIGICVRILGLVAVGVCGKQFADIEYESSDKRESFTGSLSYTCAMIILLAAYYVGIVRLAIFDLVCHYALTAIGTLFVAFALQPRENYSKQLNTLPI